MKARRVWVFLGGGFCLTAAMLAQRVWGQIPEPPLPPGLPGLPIAAPPSQPQLPAIAPTQFQLPNTPPPLPVSESVPLPPPNLNTPPASFPPVSNPTLVPPAGLPTLPPTTELRPVELPTQNVTVFKAPDLGSNENRPGKQEPSVSIEWVGPANARFNQPMNCQILVRNNGSATVHNVMVKPVLPADVKIRSSEPAINAEAVDAAWNLGTMSPGQARKIDITILPQKRGYQNYSATVTFASSTTLLTEVREPLLQIKMKAPEKVLVGEPAPIQFTLTNPGDGMTENVKVRAILPDGLEHPRGQAFEIDAGNLAPKETRTLQLACVAKTSGTLKATLIASAEGNLSSNDTIQFEALLPRLDLAMIGPKLRFVERPARYTLTVSNPGSAPAQNVVLNEIVPAGFKFQAASSQGRFDEATRTVSWQIGDLPPGQKKDITLDLIPTVPGDHRLSAAAQSSRGTRGESTLNTRVEGLSNLILEVVNADNPVEVGADATYEIRIANGGTKAETNVELVCSLPDSVDFRDAKTASGGRFRVEGREVIFEPLQRLAPRAEVIFRVTVKGRLPGDVRFRARVRAEGQTDAIFREEMTKFYDDTAVR